MIMYRPNIAQILGHWYHFYRKLANLSPDKLLASTADLVTSKDPDIAGRRATIYYHAIDSVN